MAERTIVGIGGFPNHAEASAAQVPVHILGGAAYHGQLGVVYDNRAVTRHSGDQVPVEEVDEDRT